MSYPRYSDLTPAAMAADWKPGITPEEYKLAKGARTEMLNSFGSAQPYKGTSSVSSAATKHKHRAEARWERKGNVPNYTRKDAKPQRKAA